MLFTVYEGDLRRWTCLLLEILRKLRSFGKGVVHELLRARAVAQGYLHNNVKCEGLDRTSLLILEVPLLTLRKL